ncbi:lysozyme inhibitor LprI family protein [Clostridium vincentii]
MYSVLKTQLSTNDMSNLEKEESQWIKDKDANAKKASLEFEGGTAE